VRRALADGHYAHALQQALTLNDDQLIFAAVHMPPDVEQSRRVHTGARAHTLQSVPCARTCRARTLYVCLTGCRVAWNNARHICISISCTCMHSCNNTARRSNVVGTVRPR
jgi:hypothetical protein